MLYSKFNCSLSCYQHLLMNLLLSGSLRDLCVPEVMLNCDLSDTNCGCALLDALYFIP